MRTDFAALLINETPAIPAVDDNGDMRKVNFRGLFQSRLRLFTLAIAVPSLNVNRLKPTLRHGLTLHQLQEIRDGCRGQQWRHRHKTCCEVSPEPCYQRRDDAW